MDSTRTYISVKRITGTSYFKCADVDGMLDEEACMWYGVMQGNGELAPGLSSQLASLWQRGLGKKKIKCRLILQIAEFWGGFHTMGGLQWWSIHTTAKLSWSIGTGWEKEPYLAQDRGMWAVSQAWFYLCRQVVWDYCQENAFRSFHYRP